MNATKLVRATDLLQRAIDDGAMPGGVVAVFHLGDLLLHQALGTLDGERPTNTETLYDLASLTKPLATASTLLSLVEAGEITLTATVGEFFPDASNALKEVTVKQLLTHVSGLPPWTACYDNGMGQENAVQSILRQPLAEPGTRYAYSCLGFILLQRILELVAGKTLDTLAAERIFAPLGLYSLTYTPDVTANDNIAPTVSLEGPDQDTVLVGRVHDGNARGIGGVSGNAGLFGTALDVARFGEALFGRGAQPLFGAPALKRIFANQVNPAVGFHTLLFFAQGNGYCPAGDLLSPETVGHSGYTGTLLTLDPAHGLTIALVTNSVFGDGKASFLTYRRRFLNAIAGALADIPR